MKADLCKRLSLRPFVLCLWACAASVATMLAPVQAQGPSASAVPALRAPVVTDHVGTFNGRQVSYQAAVEEWLAPTPEGRPGARIVTFSYLAREPSDLRARPVIFLFNGGPLVASVYLHMGAFGPRRVAFPDDLAADTTRLPIVDNLQTLLDIADLVFIDPAGTGFSRVVEGVAPQTYYSVTADGLQVTNVIAQWLTRHRRLESPKYVVGESYGTIRAAQVARQLLELPQPVALDGIVLLGQALNIVEFAQRPGNIMSYVVSMPTLSAMAWHHQRIARNGRTLDRFLAESRAFARSDYLRALYDGNQLGPAARESVARRLEELTGIPAGYYISHNLRITKEQYRRELLRDRGLILGALDGRYAGSPQGEGGGDPSTIVGSTLERAFRTYLRDELHVTWPDDYQFTHVPEGGRDAWGWGATSPFADWPFMSLVSQVMERVPIFRVHIGVGHFDTLTTTGASEYALSQSDWPRDRVSISYYPAGHMAYSDETSFRDFMRNMRAFVQPR
jgi:carboxypeptidase C (cathepsin A)